MWINRRLRFDIVDSPTIVEAHCNLNADLKVKLKADKTARFLFWGDNLVVKDFKILEQKNPGICNKSHQREIASRQEHDMRNAGERVERNYP